MGRDLRHPERARGGGVDCRLIYDDIGSMRFLPQAFVARLEAAGILVQAYNPLQLVLSLRYNNRDHRKICVVDGYLAMTGGTNIADEYINRKARFGHWKDTGVVVQGPAVWNFTVMYLTLWAELSCGADELEHFYAVSQAQLEAGRRLDVSPYLLPGSEVEATRAAGAEQGWLLPFDDSPYDGEHQGATLYRSMIMQASESIDIMTPYLILDDEMFNALTTSARSGVRVRIITPKIPDKPYVHATSRSYYAGLIAEGVEIYEYTPGFIHAKSIVTDRNSAVIGTINFDYRSLYLHMECAVWLHRCPMITDMCLDYEQTVAVSERISLEACQQVAIPIRLVRSFLRVFAPLL